MSIPSLDGSCYSVCRSCRDFRLAGCLAYETGGAQMPHRTVNDPHLFVSIDSSGVVSITAHRSEMAITEFLNVDGRVTSLASP